MEGVKLSAWRMVAISHCEKVSIRILKIQVATNN